MRSKWSDFFTLNFFKNFWISDCNCYSLLQLWSPLKKKRKFVNTKSTVFTKNFKTLRRTDPLLTPLDQNLYNSMVSDFDTSVDKMNHFGLFKSFLKVNSSLGASGFIPHASQRSIFIKYYKKGVAISSIPRLYASWTNAYNLMFNVFFYKIEVLTFGNSFFKNEILALNWDCKELLGTFWRFIKPFLIYQSVKINDYGDFTFRNLNNMGYYISLILDITYHKKTIYYLRKSKFYTIGIVPSNCDIKSVDAALPVVDDTIQSQLFFIRLTIIIKKNVKTYHFKELRNVWFSKNEIV